MPARKSQKRAEADKRIEEALEKLSDDNSKSIRQVARENKVSHSTLLRRLDGGRSTSESCEDQQNLTIAEEKALVEWITPLTACGNPPRHPFIREVAQEIQLSRWTRNHDPDDPSPPPLPIGDSWTQRLLHRHPELETKIGRTIEAARLKELSKETIEEWFDVLEKTIKEYEITPEDMYNMDETGFAVGSIQAAQVVVNKSLKSLNESSGTSWSTGMDQCGGMYFRGWKSNPPLDHFQG